MEPLASAKISIFIRQGPLLRGWAGDGGTAYAIIKSMNRFRHTRSLIQVDTLAVCTRLELIGGAFGVAIILYWLSH